MGKGWDDMGEGAQQREWHAAWVAQVYRVLKPNGVLMAFNGTRTHHHLSMAMQRVGFKDLSVRAWAYGSGFPKSLNIQKFLEKAILSQREKAVVAALKEKGYDEVVWNTDRE